MVNIFWLFGILVAISASAESKGRVVCYYSSWAVYRQGEAHFDIENIDASLCSHLVYAFAKLTEEGELKEYDNYNDIGDEWHQGEFTKLRALKEKYPNVILMIAVGGWNHGVYTFEQTVLNPTKRQRWVDTSVDFLKKYGFQGLDIDWEYQDDKGATEEVKNGLSETLRLFRQRFDQEGLLLSYATQANFNLIVADYDLKVLSQTLDFMNMMTYDFHGAWEKYTGCVSPLHPLASEEGNDRHLNVETVVKRYIELGFDPAKINVGMPTYGRGFTLADANNNGLYADAYGPSQMGVFVPEAGIFGYIEICRNKWPETWQDEQKVPYAFKGDQWVCYDNERSLGEKMDYMATLGVKNYMIWSIETDDWTGVCTGERYPLLRAINAKA